VKLGRLDSLTTSQEDVDNIIPSPTSNATTLVTLFQRFNLPIKDLVALSGSHSIGKARCFSIMTKLYNQSSSENQTLQLILVLKQSLTSYVHYVFIKIFFFISKLLTKLIL